VNLTKQPLSEDGVVVVGANEVLAVELLELLKVSLRVLDGVVFACVEEHRLSLIFVLSFL